MKILEHIQQNHVFPTDETVILLHTLRNNDKECITLSNWCKEQNWKFVHTNEVMGSEASVVILYNYMFEQTELYSRAKNCLIVVHK